MGKTDVKAEQSRESTIKNGILYLYQNSTAILSLAMIFVKSHESEGQ